MGIRVRIPSAGMTRFAALAILFGSILPQVLNVGHWTAPGATAAQVTHVQSTPAVPQSSGHDATGSEHDLHCHTGPSKCSGAQAMVGAVWIGEDSGLLGLDAPPRAQSRDTAILNADEPFARILHPPQAIA